MCALISDRKSLQKCVNLHLNMIGKLALSTLIPTIKNLLFDLLNLVFLQHRLETILSSVSWTVSSQEATISNINAPQPVWLKRLSLEGSLSPRLIPLSSLQSPLQPDTPNPLRDILFKSFPPVSTPPPPSSRLPYPFDVTGLFSVYDCGWLRSVAPVSAPLQARTQQDKQKLSPSKRGSTDIGGGGMSVNVWVRVLFFLFIWVCAHSLLPRGRHLISAVLGRKIGQYVGEKDVPWVRRDEETFWFTRSDRTIGCTGLLCDQPSVKLRDGHKSKVEMKRRKDGLIQIITLQYVRG